MIAEYNQTNHTFQEALGQHHRLLTRLLTEQLEILAQMPDDFELVPLPVKDPELSQYALSLMARNKSSEQSVVYASISADSVTFLLPEGPLEAKLPIMRT